MKLLDLLWAAALVAILLFMLLPATHEIFLGLSASHIYLMAFTKFAILATMGELLVLRIMTGRWNKPVGLLWRAIIWGFLGALIALVFKLYATGVSGALNTGLLPSFGGKGLAARFAFAFFTSVLMNLLFAPTFMAFHRVTDTFIDLGQGHLGSIVRLKLTAVLDAIDWNGFVTFVVCRTIPFFWIPAHTITFLLPPEYRVMMAALLSIALGAILGFAKKRVMA